MQEVLANLREYVKIVDTATIYEASSLQLVKIARKQDDQLHGNQYELWRGVEFFSRIMNPSKIVKKTKNAIKDSNYASIKELILDLEEKGIKPVLAIDGEVKNLRLKILHESELNDFYAIIDSANIWLRNDFLVLETDEALYSGDIYKLDGTAIVVCKKSGKLREYKAEWGSCWISDFSLDLKNNFFV